MEINEKHTIKGLKYCKRQMLGNGSCKACPYYSAQGGCLTDLIGDALALINSYKQRDKANGKS